MDDLFKQYPKSVLDKFKKFHLENPNIYNEFKKLSFEIKKTGIKKYGARTIFEVMRWRRDVNSSGNPFKLCNDFIPIYKRLLAYNHKEFLDFFEFREVTSKGIGSMEENLNG